MLLKGIRVERHIYRSGDSVEFTAGLVAESIWDIHDLFMDTGLWDSFSIDISQGKVEESHKQKP